MSYRLRATESRPFFLDVAAGNVPGHEVALEFGRNPDIYLSADSSVNNASVTGGSIWL